VIARFQGRELDAHYLGFFDCFNRQLFFEAHDVLEEFWLPQRFGANGPFFKGLIQLAGAFVHLQKDRLGPASALLKLARDNLEPYPAVYERLDLEQVRSLIADWLGRIENAGTNPLSAANAPRLMLVEGF